MLTQGPRGTKDVLPDTSCQWQYVEKKVRATCDIFAYQEIRTPIFEHTELFLRGIGETTDIVEKEMYTFQDRGERSITLRPENTAAVVRSFLENKLYGQATQPVKLFYVGPMFRYDKPQAGRFRQFHQFGAEAIGTQQPTIDAEIITLAVRFLQDLGLTELKLQLNSVGCPKCRPAYRDTLKAFFANKLTNLCSDCQSRYERNPLRILDCKNTACQAASAGVPEINTCLCSECDDHFATLQRLLGAADIDFTINPRLVRGLDYYTKTAFEIQYAPLGAQSAVCGGGRYDGLIEECGGPATPAIGFAIGIERVLLALEKQNLLPELTKASTVFIAPLGEAAQLMAFKLLFEIRRQNIAADMDFMGRSIKAQLKQANRQQARFVAIIGDDEAASGNVMLKDMAAGTQELISASEVANTILKQMGEL
ncbi:histidine--tRNA ligase [Azotosporobacter soli]|uniref:histidine--tRNA ligase n=1 Tax=Azotosporobacter soli TaxID=3055040 RepID=UPI0031FE774A